MASLKCKHTTSRKFECVTFLINDRDIVFTTELHNIPLLSPDTVLELRVETHMLL